MNKWIAEFELEDGDTMPEHMDLEYKGARIDFHCKPLKQEPTTKNDLGVDCISRHKHDMIMKHLLDIIKQAHEERDIAIQQLHELGYEFGEKIESTTKNDFVSRAEVLKLMKDNWHTHNGDWAMQESMDDIRALPSVTPQPCEDAVSRQAVLDLIADYDLSMGQVVKGIHALPSVTPQEPILDKIRAEIAEYGSIWVQYQITGRSDKDIQQLVIDVLKQAKEQVLDVIDKYKAESEKV